MSDAKVIRQPAESNAKPRNETRSVSTPGVKGHESAKAIGRRKRAIAHVRLVDDAAQRQINGQAIEVYFPTISMQQNALEPLVTTSQGETYGFEAKVLGGGKHAQAAAVKLGLARALVIIDEGFRKQLKDTKALTRDPRIKERKKYGLKRARRAPQFSKR